MNDLSQMIRASFQKTIGEPYSTTITTPPMEPDSFVFYGTAEADTAIGTCGDDVFRMGGGDDFVLGRAGADRLIGGAGNDDLFGEEGRDVLKGGAGDDQLWGGAGRDVFVGGEGRDVFHLRDESDVVLDFVRGEDRIVWDDFA